MDAAIQRVVRAYQRKIIRKAEGQKTWQDFLDTMYDGGHRKVPNPNPETRSQWPKVTLFTALEDAPTREKVEAEFHRWKEVAHISNPKPITPSFEASFLPDSEAREKWADQIDRNFDRRTEKAILGYAYDEYSGINKALRDKQEKKPRKIQESIDLLDAALNKSSIPNTLKVIRQTGLSNPIAKGLESRTITPEMTITDLGYMSTSVDKDWKDWKTYTITILIPKGARGLYLGDDSKGDNLSRAPWECELILPRGSTVKILSVDYNNKSVECELLPDFVVEEGKARLAMRLRG
jgi:hypothetical protein